MKLAHLILAHKNPQQLERLINALKHPGFDFYIHVDAKSDQKQFEYLSSENVFFIKKRTKIYWAGYGTIQATINGFEEMAAKNYDYTNVISAQDFPLKNADSIYLFFEKNIGKEFTTCESIKDEWIEAAPRISRYSFINWKIPGKFRLEIIANKILPKRKFPLQNFELVGRANWFTLSNKAVIFILDFLKKNPAVIRYFKYVWGADEFIFSSILFNSDFKKDIEKNVVYVDWSEKKAHPKLLTTADLEALKQTDKLFGRKFDMEKDAEIFDLLEEFIKSK
jgi:hypothetical protein